MGKAAAAPEVRQMSAIAMIIVFLAVIAVLNRLEFGRVD
jgi:hypothetical protein